MGNILSNAVAVNESLFTGMHVLSHSLAVNYDDTALSTVDSSNRALLIAVIVLLICIPIICLGAVVGWALCRRKSQSLLPSGSNSKLEEPKTNMFENNTQN
jgi:ABC-type transport system involved in cytochrome c biogenesis permease component